MNIAAWRFSHKCDVCGKAVSYVGHKSIEGYTTVCYLCDEHAPRLNLLTTAPEPDYRWHGLVFMGGREMDRIMRRLWRDYWEASFERALEGVL